mgnify:CR=1 FL=1
MDRNTIQNQQFDAERALYHLQHTDVEGCIFAGPADGESALKEARDVRLLPALPPLACKGIPAGAFVDGRIGPRRYLVRGKWRHLG